MHSKQGVNAHVFVQYNLKTFILSGFARFYLRIIADENENIRWLILF
jgi:hypothetical protein